MTAAERRAVERVRRSLERGDEDALGQLEQLLELREGFADLHYMAGLLHERRNDHPAAAHSLRRALRINPSYTEALLALASVYEQQGDFGRSQEVATRAQQVGRRGPGPLDATTRGKLANLQAALGDAYREVGELREAIEAYRKALDRCPDFHDIRQRLGVALREAGLPDRALAEFRRVLRAHPGYLDAAVQAGLTLYSLGRSAEAAEQWRAVLDREPGHAGARMYLRMLGGPEPAP